MPTKALGLLALLALLLGTVAARAIAVRKATKTSAVYTVTATAYEAVTGQTDSKPFITADNSRIPRGYGSHTRWLALSRDLLRPWGGPFDFGDKVRVTGISPALDGVYTIHDTMNRRYRHRLDVLAHPREHLSLSRTGVKLRRVGSSHPRPPKARLRPVAAQPATKPPANRPRPAKALATAKATARGPKHQQATPTRHKARATKRLAASLKRPRRRAARLRAASK